MSHQYEKIAIQLFDILSENQLRCKLCKVILDGQGHLNIVNTHQYSQTHVETLTSYIVNSQEFNQGKPFQRPDPTAELFSIPEAIQLREKSMKDLRGYFSKCIKERSNLLQGLEQQTVETYIRVLKRFYVFLLENGKSNLDKDLALKFLENNNSTHVQTVMRKLLSTQDHKIEGEQKSQMKNLKENRVIRRITNAEMNKYFPLFQSQLEDQKYLKELLIYMIISNGVAPQRICKVKLEELVMRNKYKEGHINEQQKFQEQINNIATILLNNQEHKDGYLVDQKSSFAEINKHLKQIRDKLKGQQQDKEYQEFLLKASLKAIHEVKKKKKNEEQNADHKFIQSISLSLLDKNSFDDNDDDSKLISVIQEIQSQQIQNINIKQKCKSNKNQMLSPQGSEKQFQNRNAVFSDIDKESVIEVCKPKCQPKQTSTPKDNNHLRQFQFHDKDKGILNQFDNIFQSKKMISIDDSAEILKLESNKILAEKIDNRKESVINNEDEEKNI